MYFIVFLDQIEVTQQICQDGTCQKQDEADQDDLDDYDDDDDDLYALLVIPILGVIGGFLTYLFKRYKNRILLRVLDRVMDWIDGDEREVSTEAETDTSTLESTLVKERLRVTQNLDISSSSLSSQIWDNRMTSDAQKIYLNIMEDMRDETDQSSTTAVEIRDVGIQISLSSETEEQVELLDISVPCEQEVMETSFVETRSGQKYQKDFIIKK